MIRLCCSGYAYAYCVLFDGRFFERLKRLRERNNAFRERPGVALSCNIYFITLPPFPIKLHQSLRPLAAIFTAARTPFLLSSVVDKNVHI